MQRKIIIAILLLVFTPLFLAAEEIKSFKTGNKYGYKNESGRIVIPAIFDDAYWFSDGLAAVKQNGKYGFIDKSGNFVIPAKYEKVRSFSDGLAAVEQNGKYGYIDDRGDFVIPAKFDESWSFSDGLAIVKQDGKYGYVNKGGNIVIPVKFDLAYDFSGGLAVVKQGDKWGSINKSGNFVIPAKFDDAYWFTDGLALVWQNRKKGYIDRQGNFYESQKDGRKAVAAHKALLSKPFDKYIASEIGSLDSYMLSKGIKSMSDEEFRVQVETEISRWQQKDEFESTTQWRQRVTEESRAAKVSEIAERISGDYNRRMQEAHQEYISKYEALAGEYCEYRSAAFAKQELTLRPYDADNQTFLISTATYGDILLPVPLAEAQAFKRDWTENKAKVKAVFVPVGDDVALQSVSFGKYVYDSNTRANYAQVDVDYNFKPVDLANLDFNFEAIDDGESVGKSRLSTPVAVTPRRYEPEQKKIAAGDASDVDVDIPVGSRKAPNTFAVVIANGNYAHASRVANAENDGRTMEKYLTRTLGIPEKNITTYIDATYGQMASAVGHLRDIAEAYGSDGFNVLFYYVGHGLPDDNNRESYILPVDVDPKNIEICYPLEKLYSQLGNLGAQSVTVMVDACFSGANHGDGMLIPQSMGVTVKPKASRPTGNMVVLSTAEGDETAFPYASQGHGLFTYWLLTKLKESRGEVTLGELSDYVSDKVKKTSVVENRKRQTPTVATSQSLASTWRNLYFGR